MTNNRMVIGVRLFRECTHSYLDYPLVKPLGEFETNSLIAMVMPGWTVLTYERV